MYSIYKIATFNVPHALRSASRTIAMVKLFVTYLQFVSVKLDLFVAESLLRANMTGQVCMLEKMLQLVISPQAVINPNPVEVILYRQDELTGIDVFIDDNSGMIFHHTSEFGLGEFAVLLPSIVSVLEPYAREILDQYKLPGTAYTIHYR